MLNPTPGHHHEPSDSANSEPVPCSTARNRSSTACTPVAASSFVSEEAYHDSVEIENHPSIILQIQVQVQQQQ